jgi:homocysteine S-methyltransferase
MINCAHPSHFAGVPSRRDGAWRERIGGLRGNASAKSHAELDEAGRARRGRSGGCSGPSTARCARAWAPLTVLGGCCGTDRRHVDASPGWLD